MATYCIGDVHGCYRELVELLKMIDYKQGSDELWFAGDLVNRGTDSLSVLRLVKTLSNVKVTLGNHDLHLLTFYHSFVDFESESFAEIMQAPDREELINWLRQQPLIIHDAARNLVVAHAGIYPWWTIAAAVAYAREVTVVLQRDDYADFLREMYGDEPNVWYDDLTGFARLRFIVNAFTRMRFCDLNGKLEFAHIGKIGSQPPGYLPWFKIPWRKSRETKIMFGHWAAQEGECDEPNVIGIDTGCVWGGSLTAVRIDDGKIFAVKKIS